MALAPWLAAVTHTLKRILITLQLDSILGATIQETRQSSNTSRIVPDEVASAFSSDLKVISGIDILTNNQVTYLIQFFVFV